MPLCGSSYGCGCAITGEAATAGELDGFYPTIGVDGSGTSGTPWTLTLNEDWVDAVVNRNPQIVPLPADVVNNEAVANTLTDVTGLSFPVAGGGWYAFRFVIFYTAGATTTGSRWSINGPAALAVRYSSRYSLTTTTETLNEGLSAYDLPAAANATSAATGSNLAVIEGSINMSASGDVIARFASEVSASAITVKRGSYVQWMDCS